MTGQALYTVTQHRAIERAAGPGVLMEKAGLAAARLAERLIEARSGPVLVVAGPGNNGGDAFVAARHLRAGGRQVNLVFCGDVATLPPDAKAAHAAWQAAGGTCLDALPRVHHALVVDGLFGTGLSRPPQDRPLAMVRAINALTGVPVLALDLPSGLDADTGRVPGMAVRATHTLTFLGLKPGLFTLDGPDYVGALHRDDLGTATLAPPPAGWLLDTLPDVPPLRQRNSHKGCHGNVKIVGGAAGMVGAALLAARAALLIGAGQVHCCLLDARAGAFDPQFPELLWSDTAGAAPEVWVVGPGMGRTTQAEEALRAALDTSVRLVLDADALHLLAGAEGLRRTLSRRKPPAVLTPHPGEAAALLQCTVADIQSDRIAAACNIAHTFHAITVLKGCGSIIATPEGRWHINASGNPGLASAGMGDVLCGIIAGLMAQGMEEEPAVLLGVSLHGAAADALVAQGIGPLGLTASEVMHAARRLLNRGGA